MYFFTSDTIAQANENIKNLDSKFGGLLCVLHSLTGNLEENVSYTIDGEKLRKQLSFVFDKEPRDSFDNAKPSYIIFAKDWVSTFFENCIKNKADLLSCAVFFLRRQGFEREYTREEVIDLFIKRFNLKNIKEFWFCDSSKLELVYNQYGVENNQVEFYSKMEYSSDFKSIDFNGVIKKSAVDLKAAGHVQTLYSGSGVQKCFLLSDEPLDKYYIMSNSKQNLGNQHGEELEDIFSGYEPWLISRNNPDYTGKQKYAGYAKAIVKLVEFMHSNNLIEDADLNDKNIEKYKSWVEIYEGSDEAKEFDVNKNSNKGGSAALKKYVKYIKYLITPHAVDFDYSTTKGDAINKIFYGVPGCGKSHHIQHTVLKGYEKENVIRTTFYQDYSNTDFVGQILPKIVKGENGDRDTVEYIFNPGPFTLALIQAISNPDKKVALIVEEINRGNAPAIFGDIFQLLDRGDDGISEYGIVNVGMMDYLNAHEFEVDGEKKRYAFGEIKIPGNMDIFATMNTSDQNVYTLDTAFTRRWAKERIPNSFNGNELEKWLVPGMDKYTWGEFVTAINAQIQNKLDDLQVNEDKQVGAFFVKKADLLAADHTLSDEDKKAKAISFAHKVLEYLWDDVSKLDHSVIFNPVYKTFEKVVEDYLKVGAAIFNSEIFKN